MSTLSELLSSRVKAEIFCLLFGANEAELHVREIARRAGLAEATVRQELRRLARLGLVTRRKDSNRAYFRANLQHPLHGDIRNLVLKTSGMVQLLSEALSRDSKGIVLAFVFGSMASGTEKAWSDVDLMVIGDIGLRELGRRLSGVAARIGREINPHAMTVRGAIKRKRSSDHFLTNVLEGPKLFVLGAEHELEAMG